jgi:hypothetical protein
MLVRIAYRFGALQIIIVSQHREPAKWVYNGCRFRGQKGNSGTNVLILVGEEFSLRHRPGYFDMTELKFSLQEDWRFFEGTISRSQTRLFEGIARVPFFYWGLLLLCLGLAAYFIGTILLFFRWLLLRGPAQNDLSIAILVFSGMATLLGLISVHRVIVVSNNRCDRTFERAVEAGAVAVNEQKPGHGRCVYRYLQEALACQDAELMLLCEGDMPSVPATFRSSWPIFCTRIS